MSFWSVVQTESRREHVAAKFLERDFQVYYPKIMNDVNVRERVAPLFPGYLFVEILDHWWSVRWTVGVIRLLMINERPAKLPSGMLDLIRDSEGVDGLVRLPERKAKPKSRALKRGDAIRMTTGSLSGRIGVYQGQSGLQRSHILLNLLGREVKVSVAAGDVARL